MAHIPYSITSQRFIEEIDPSGHFVDTWEITYVGPSGVHGRVKVPASQYSAPTVDREIQDQLNHVETVHQLGSAPVGYMPDEGK